jgi:hypothetical protein
VELFASAANGGDEIGGLEHVQVLGGRLTRHVEWFAEFAQGLAVALVQAVQERATGRIGERFEDRIVVGHGSIMQVNTCVCQEGASDTDSASAIAPSHVSARPVAHSTANAAGSSVDLARVTSVSKASCSSGDSSASMRVRMACAAPSRRTASGAAHSHS